MELDNEPPADEVRQVPDLGIFPALQGGRPNADYHIIDDTELDVCLALIGQDNCTGHGVCTTLAMQ